MSKTSSVVIGNFTVNDLFTFRLTCRSRLFSKFTISTTSHQHVRIASAHLNIPEDGLDGVKIVTPSTKNRPVVVSRDPSFSSFSPDFGFSVRR